MISYFKELIKLILGYPENQMKEYYVYTAKVNESNCNQNVKNCLNAVIRFANGEDQKNLLIFKMSANKELLEGTFDSNSLLKLSREQILAFVYYRFNVIDLHIGIAIALMKKDNASELQDLDEKGLLTILKDSRLEIFFKKENGEKKYVEFKDRLAKEEIQNLSLENIKKLQILRNKLAHPLFKDHSFLSAKNNTDEYNKICDEMAVVIEASMNDLSKLKKEVVNHLERIFPR